jgi:hypothetical protein
MGRNKVEKQRRGRQRRGRETDSGGGGGRDVGDRQYPASKDNYSMYSEQKVKKFFVSKDKSIFQIKR